MEVSLAGKGGSRWLWTRQKQTKTNSVWNKNEYGDEAEKIFIAELFIIVNRIEYSNSLKKS